MNNELNQDGLPKSLDIQEEWGMSPVEQENFAEFRSHYEAPEMHMSEDEREALRITRNALSEIAQDSLSTTLKATAALDIIESVAGTKGGEVGMLKEKQVKREALKRKEQSPRSYSEMLVVVNDLQLLRSADDEAIGAFMAWLKANGKKITHMVANGDILDFEAQTGFAKIDDSEDSQSKIAEDEIEAGKWFFETVSTYLPNAEKVLVWGNHEQRYLSAMKDRYDGDQPWRRTPREMFRLEELGWKEIPYGMNQRYEWHNRIFWHGARAGAKSDIAKLELQDTGLVSVTTAHVNRNMYHEERRANGELSSGLTHGGFSKDSLTFMKKANTGWSQGFGIYFWDKKVGEQAYSVIMKHGNPRFIDPTGEIYDGSGYNLRQEIGLDPKPRRGRPRKS